jgi:hypothetical protein
MVALEVAKNHGFVLKKMLIFHYHEIVFMEQPLPMEKCHYQRIYLGFIVWYI